MRCSRAARAAIAVLAVSAGFAITAPIAAASDTLVGGQTLTAGQELTSADGHYVLEMQTDGNLVLYVRNGNSIHRAVWSSDTAGDLGDRAVLQSNGNLVLYSPANQALWSSNTSSAGCTNLVLQDDGNLVLYNHKQAVWSTHTVNTTLQPNDELLPGQRIFSSDEHFVLYMQTDGNLVLYGPTGALWSTGTWGIPGNHAIMQADGNLVVYSTAGRALWASGTHGDSGSTAVVQDDANFVIYDHGKPVWASNTANRALDTGKYEFSPPAFIACPPPPPPPPPPPAAAPEPVVQVPVATQVPVVTKVPVAKKLHRLHVAVTMSWTWDLGHTRLHRIKVRNFPRRATVRIYCRGRGCVSHRGFADSRQLRRLLRSLSGHTYRAGDRLVITIWERGYKSEHIGVQIRYGRLPKVGLL